MASTHAPFPTMTTSRDTNPLRPYYVPPSIGIPADQTPNTTAPKAASSGAGIGKSARDFLSDLDYGGPFLDKDGPTVAETGKKFVDQAIWKYTSVLLAQPFDVAKTILQVRLAAAASDAEPETKTPSSRRRTASPLDAKYSDYPLSETESSEDEPSYFTPTKPPQRSSSRYDNGSPRRRHSRRRPSPPSRTGSSTPIPGQSDDLYAQKLNIRNPDSVMEVLSQLWQHSGATGLWKATNATFLNNILVKAVESWTRSLLCALCNLPDPSALSSGPSELVASAMGGLDITDSPAPMASLAVAVAAAGIAGVLLSPLDIVRTRFVLYPGLLTLLSMIAN